MPRRWMAGAMLMLACGPALAALPPHYQRQAELNEIIAVVTDLLGIGQPIDAIVMTETDRFEVRAGSCTVDVEIFDVPQAGSEPMVGPRNFAVEASAVVCP